MPEHRLSRDLDAVGTACDRAVRLVTEAGWAPPDVTRVALALGEAVANAVEHGAGDEIVLALDLDRDVLQVCVGDSGPGPSPQRLDAARLPDDPLALGGRGLFILNHVADRVWMDGSQALCVTIRQSP